MDNIKLFATKILNVPETLLLTIGIYSQDTRMKFGIKIRHVYEEKREKPKDGRNRPAKSGKHKQTQRKRNLQNLGHIGSG